MPGRKTATSEAAWIAGLLSHELLKASFVPLVEYQNLRDWMRVRVKQREERNRIQSRIEKVLEGSGGHESETGHGGE
jgi:hypothetical protein